MHLLDHDRALADRRGDPFDRSVADVADREDPAEALRRLSAGLADGWLAEDLGAHLTRAEVKATRTRIDLLVASRVHPLPPEDWPAVPWPPY